MTKDRRGAPLPKRTPRTIEDGVELIELRVEEARNLFEPLDPAPLAERDLSRNVAAYLLSELDEIDTTQPVRLVLHLRREDLPLVPEISAAIRRHFSWSAEVQRRRLRDTLRRGWRSMGRGLLAVALLIALAQLVASLDLGRLIETLAESITIIAWVILWRPAELLLFDWRPMRERCAMFERLASIAVEPFLDATDELSRPATVG